MPNAYLQRASFKGVTFEVTGSTITAGRRVVLHEYPYRDQPYAEDLGRRARTIAIQAFIFGSNARQQSERLIAAIEAEGAGTLIHPLYGSMTCIAVDGTQVETELFEDYVSVSFTLTEVGSLTFPSTASAADFLARLSADALQSLANEGLQSAMSGLKDTGADLGAVYDAARNACSECVSAVEDSVYASLWSLEDELAELTAAQETVITDPAAYAQTVQTALGLARRANTVTDWREVSCQAASLSMEDVFKPESVQADIAAAEAAALLRSRARAVRSANEPALLAAYTGPTVSTATTEAKNKAASGVRALYRLQILAQAIGASTLVSTALDRRDEQAAAMVIAPRRDVAQVRDLVIAAVDAECALQTDHAVLGLLYDARVRVWTDLSRRADQINQVQTVELPRALPSLVVAYNLYADASREGEIVDRNAVANPLFCSGSLEVKAE